MWPYMWRLRAKLRVVVASRWFDGVALAAVVANCGVLGLNDPMSAPDSSNQQLQLASEKVLP